MTSIISHAILQALLSLATSDICPPADWFPEGSWDGKSVKIGQCVVPLSDDMTAKDAKLFYRTARKLARGN